MAPPLDIIPISDAPYYDTAKEFLNYSPLDILSLYTKGGWYKLKHLFDADAHGAVPEILKHELSPYLGKSRPEGGTLDRALNYAGAYDWGIRDNIPADEALAMAKLHQYRKFDIRPHDAVRDYVQNVDGLRAAYRDKALGLDQRPHSILEEAITYGTSPQVMKSQGGPVTRKKTFVEELQEALENA